MTEECIFRPRNSRVPYIKYFITFPTGFDPETESLPLILFLHGAGERGDDPERLRTHGIPKLFGADPDWHGLRVVTVSPLCPDGIWWNEIIGEVKRLTDGVVRRYRIDRDRVSATGLSMGGFGCWELGMRYPRFLSACAPICGGGDPDRAHRLKNVPVRTYHGVDDPVVPIQCTIDMVEALRKAGGNVSANYLPGLHHDSWTYAYEKTDLIEWLIEQRRGT